MLVSLGVGGGGGRLGVWRDQSKTMARLIGKTITTMVTVVAQIDNKTTYGLITSDVAFRHFVLGPAVCSSSPFR